MWNRLFKQWASASIKDILQGIPLSLFFALLAMFFIVVIASREGNFLSTFLSIWKWAYLIIVIVSQAKVGITVLTVGFGVQSQAKQWNMPTDELFVAIWDLKVATAIKGGVVEFFKMNEADAKDHIAKCIEIHNLY